VTEPIRSSIEAASTYLMEHPDEARYTDSIATATVMDALHVRVVGPAGESIETDMPTAVGGSGEQAGPGWVFRAGLAACVASLAAMRAAQVGLDDFRCEVGVDSESDDRGILGLDPDVPAGPLSVRITLRLAAGNATGDDLEALAAWAVAHCPVSEAVGRAVPVTVTVANA